MAPLKSYLFLLGTLACSAVAQYESYDDNELFTRAVVEELIKRIAPPPQFAGGPPPPPVAPMHAPAPALAAAPAGPIVNQRLQRVIAQHNAQARGPVDNVQAHGPPAQRAREGQARNPAGSTPHHSNWHPHNGPGGPGGPGPGAGGAGSGHAIGARDLGEDYYDYGLFEARDLYYDDDDVIWV